MVLHPATKSSLQLAPQRKITSMSLLRILERDGRAHELDARRSDDDTRINPPIKEKIILSGYTQF